MIPGFSCYIRQAGRRPVPASFSDARLRRPPDPHMLFVWAAELLMLQTQQQTPSTVWDNWFPHFHSGAGRFRLFLELYMAERWPGIMTQESCQRSANFPVHFYRPYWESCRLYSWTNKCERMHTHNYSHHLFYLCTVWSNICELMTHLLWSMSCPLSLLDLTTTTLINQYVF